MPQYSNGEKAMVAEITYPFIFNRKSLGKKYKDGDYVTVDGIRQFTYEDGYEFRDADQPVPSAHSSTFLIAQFITFGLTTIS